MREIHIRSREEREKAMMQNPRGWPRYPILPVKKRPLQPGEWPTCGIMTSATGANVYEISIYNLETTPDIAKWLEENVPPEKIHKFESFDVAIMAGWVVD
jgi:hypothetical protein